MVVSYSVWRDFQREAFSDVYHNLMSWDVYLSVQQALYEDDVEAAQRVIAENLKRRKRRRKRQETI
jgi:hypothetical protein